MFEKELQTYLKAAAPALPCAEARAAFAAYVRGAAQDVCGGDPQTDFAAAAAQLGTDPEQAARDFVQSQSPETLARWQAAARRRKVRLRLAVGLTIGVLAVLVAFFVVTKGVLLVNTETTIINWGDTDMTQEELDQITQQISEQIAKEHENDGTK